MAVPEEDDWLFRELAMQLADRAVRDRAPHIVDELTRELRGLLAAETAKLATLPDELLRRSAASQVNVSRDIMTLLDRIDGLRDEMRALLAARATPAPPRAGTVLTLDPQSLQQLASAVTAKLRAGGYVRWDEAPAPREPPNDQERAIADRMQQRLRMRGYAVVASICIAGLAVGYYVGSRNAGSEEQVAKDRTIWGAGEARGGTNNQASASATGSPAQLAAAVPSQPAVAANASPLPATRAPAANPPDLFAKLAGEPVRKVCEKEPPEARVLTCLFPGTRNDGFTRDAIARYLNSEPQDARRLLAGVALLQAFARARGARHEHVDGKWGEGTRAAINELACMRGQKLDGPTTGAQAAVAFETLLVACGSTAAPR